MDSSFRICPHCLNNVKFSSDWKCPACRKHINSPIERDIEFVLKKKKESQKIIPSKSHWRKIYDNPKLIILYLTPILIVGYGIVFSSFVFIDFYSLNLSTFSIIVLFFTTISSIIYGIYYLAEKKNIKLSKKWVLRHVLFTYLAFILFFVGGVILIFEQENYDYNLSLVDKFMIAVMIKFIGAQVIMILNLIGGLYSFLFKRNKKTKMNKA